MNIKFKLDKARSYYILYSYQVNKTVKDKTKQNRAHATFVLVIDKALLSRSLSLSLLVTSQQTVSDVFDFAADGTNKTFRIKLSYETNEWRKVNFHP